MKTDLSWAGWLGSWYSWLMNTTSESASETLAAAKPAMDSLAWSILPIRGPRETLGRFLTYGRGAEGTFRLDPAGGLSEDHLVSIYFEPALPAGVTWVEAHMAAIQKGQATPVRDRAYYERCAQVGLGENKLGYIAELALTMGAITRFRGQTLPDGNTDEILEEAGFKYQHSVNETTRIFYRAWGKRGTFILFVSEDNVHLTFEKKNNVNGWHNLARFQWCEVWGDEKAKPIIWPASLADPARVGLMMALAVADAWDPNQVYGR